MSVKHTASPWHIVWHDDHIEGRGIIRANVHVRNHKHEYVALTSEFNSKNWKVDAEFIVRACNAHDDLLEAAKKAIKTMNFYMKSDLDRRMVDCDTFDELSAAIAKAEGK